MSLKLTLFCSLILKKHFFLNKAVKRTIDFKQEQYQHLLLAGDKLKHCELSFPINFQQ